MLVAKVAAVCCEEDLTCISKNETILPPVVEDSNIVTYSIAIAVHDNDVFRGNSVLVGPSLASPFPEGTPQHVQCREDKHMIHSNLIVVVSFHKLQRRL